MFALPLSAMLSPSCPLENRLEKRLNGGKGKGALTRGLSSRTAVVSMARTRTGQGPASASGAAGEARAGPLMSRPLRCDSRRDRSRP